MTHQLLGLHNRIDLNTCITGLTQVTQLTAFLYDLLQQRAIAQNVSFQNCYVGQFILSTL